MCGRLFNGINQTQVEQFAGAKFENTKNDYTKHFNVCPTHNLPVITYRDPNPLHNVKQKVTDATINENTPETKFDEKSLHEKDNCIVVHGNNDGKLQDDFEINPSRKLEALSWGWTTQYGPVINCRFEEAYTKGMFKKYLQTNRCVVIVQGYYEWNKEKDPYVIRNKNPGLPLFLGGIVNTANEVLLCTRPANPMMEKVHHRMGISLNESDIDMWLDPKADYHKDIIQKLTLDDSKLGFECLTMYRVAPLVSKIHNIGKENIETYEDFQKNLDKTGIMSFFQKPKKDVKNIDQDEEIPQSEKPMQDPKDEISIIFNNDFKPKSKK